MIAFACMQCGMKFQVKDEFAGRSTSCLTCKQPLTVPALETSQMTVAADRIESAISSLRQAGLDAEVTVEQAKEYAVKAGKPLAKRLAERTRQDERYLLEDEIARGGMGAVLRAIDTDLRREVAVKFLLDNGDAKKKLRFVEEAQITGQLEHPNIVPIHEIGVNNNQQVFFSMKLVQGHSLADALDLLRKDSPEASKKYPLSRLLTIFINVCHALAYAHSRNVIHRDLKPSNIMIGEFGEVYVMDWGLAKLLTEGHAPVDADGVNRYYAALTATPAPQHVATSVENTELLTQEGAIVGTPTYMSPEQARGHAHAVDERSDIYSLGAILYAMLTLQPPVERGGDALAILMRVAKGEIKRPEERGPKRSIPPELSAIAMKALAKEPKDRYQTVETLRRDVDLFLADRSVSAKHDTLREQVWKLFRRNKGVAFATTTGVLLLAVVLTIAFRINYTARVHAEQQQEAAESAHRKFEKEQKEKEAAVRRTLPVLVRAGQQLANENQIDQAEAQVRLALSFDAKNPEARLFNALILVSRKKWADARADLEAYLKQKPNHHEARLMFNVISEGKPSDGSTLMHVIESLQRQKLPGLATPLLADIAQIVAAKKQLVLLYRDQVEAHWKGKGSRVTLNKDGDLSLNLDREFDIPDLTALQDLKLNTLSLWQCRQITDVTPLQGMPLHYLSLSDCRVDDLSPLRNMPLKTLHLDNNVFDSLEPLRGMPLRHLMMLGCRKVSTLEPLTGMKLKQLKLSDCEAIDDLTPLYGMPLEKLWLNGCTAVKDLGPLREAALEYVHLEGCRSIVSLAALKGQPLKTLYGRYLVLVNDLSPLRDMPLADLHLNDCPSITTLEPLRGLPLRTLHVGSSKVSDLEPLRGMDLVDLGLGTTRVKNLEPLRDMKLKRLWLGGCTIDDLAPIQDLPLQFLSITPNRIKKNLDVVLKMKSLSIIETGYLVYHTPEEFWKKYQNGEFK